MYHGKPLDSLSWLPLVASWIVVRMSILFEPAWSDYVESCLTIDGGPEPEGTSVNLIKFTLKTLTQNLEIKTDLRISLPIKKAPMTTGGSYMGLSMLAVLVCSKD